MHVRVRIGTEAFALVSVALAMPAVADSGCTAPGSNPLFRDKFTADPAPLVVGDALYLYVDVSGHQKVSLTDEISEFQVSSDHRHVAVISLSGTVAPDPGELITFSNQSRRRRLRVLDIVTGQNFEPCSDCDLLDASVEFSNGGQLAVIARRDGATWKTARPYVLRDTRLVSLGAAQSKPERIVWSHEDLLAQSADQSWLVSNVGLDTTQPAIGRYSLAATTHGVVWLSNSSGAWRVTPRLTLAKVATDRSRVIDLDLQDAASAGSRRFRQPDVLVLRGSGRNLDHIRLGTGDRHPVTVAIPAGAEVLAVSTREEHVVSLSTDSHGVSRLLLNSPASPPGLIDTISARLADVIPPRMISLKRKHGESILIDWLLLPPGTGPFPTVIFPYQGITYGEKPPSLSRPENLSPVFKPQILTSNGYAVLLPSIPEGPVGHPQETLVADLNAAVDAALATRLIDPSRMAIHGHSYGGVNALTIATRSTRYRAIISSSGVNEFAGSYGSLGPAQKISFVGGPPVDGNIAWYESGQGRFDAAPWSAPERYRRASSFFEADRIHVPLLLIAAELDFFPMEQAEQLFIGLGRLDRDVTLLRLYGDGHIQQNPGNIRLEWQTILKFLEDKMPARGTTEGTVTTSGATSSPCWRTGGTRGSPCRDEWHPEPWTSRLLQNSADRLSQVSRREGSSAANPGCSGSLVHSDPRPRPCCGAGEPTAEVFP
ncbi:dipeptidyl aminopeptidase/acylaminoacyl peptidase [Sphingomonas sp. UYP23]